MTQQLRALIFDVDGTLADTESAHCAAFNSAFAESGLDWRWDEALYTNLLEVSGGKERILHYWRGLGPAAQPSDAVAQAAMVQGLHQRKTAFYERLVEKGAVHMRPGVLELIASARQAGMDLAIATTTSTANIDALLRSALGPDWRAIFPVVEDAASAPLKKPNPQVYVQALQRLGRAAAQCLAIEDSANGLQAARAAGLATLVTPNNFTAHHDFAGALRVVPNLAGVTPSTLQAWHAAASAA